MSLSLNDHLSMMKGFAGYGFSCIQTPSSATNPIRIEWNVAGQVRRFRLWAFDVTHGGGGPTVRAADEYRIQITNGPAKIDSFDSGGAVDLLVGYSRDRDAIVAYDRSWLEDWTRKLEETGSGGSPSVQVKEADIQAGHDKGLHHLTKVRRGSVEANIVTMSPDMLPAYLLNYNAVLGGMMAADKAMMTTPHPAGTTVVDYCIAQGFPFDPDLIARYLASLLTKPFVILAGVSGTGKSKLAELVAEFYSPSLALKGSGAKVPSQGDTFIFVPPKGPPDPTRFALVAVRPDWIDNQSILGFVNPITEKYESTQALDLILRARNALNGAPEEAKAPRYFMLLDEMNLARVEHYFSDWLACTESRRYLLDGSIIQQSVPLHRAERTMETVIQRPDGSTETVEVPGALFLPTNLVVTGTVNVDETTFGFSPKVLDRGMVLEFDEVDLERLRSGPTAIATGAFRFPDTLPPFRLPTADDYANLPPGSHKHLISINQILEGARLHFGYRTANEVALFMRIYNEILPPDPEDTDWLHALDAGILQKILPRIQGNRARLEVPLARLCKYFLDLSLPEGDMTLEEFDPKARAKLSRSYRRAVEMIEALRGFGFVSFFK